MVSGCLRRDGRVLLTALFLIIPLTGAFSEQIKTTLQPGRIRPGESSNLQIKIENVESAEPVSVPSVEGLVISFIGSQRYSSTRIINWKKYSSSGVILSFSVMAERSGRFTIPPIIIEADEKRLRSKTVSLIVLDGMKGFRGGSTKFHSEIFLSKKRVYTGEPIIVRYFLLHNGPRFEERPVFERLPEMKGFIRKRFDELIEDDAGIRDGVDYVRTHIATFILVPTEGGSFKIGGGTVIVSVVNPDRFFSFSFPQRKRIIFNKKNVKVLNLPERGKLQNFHGDVGIFNIDINYDKEPLKVFEERMIKLRIRGSGNLISISKPVLERMSDVIKVISEDGKESLRIERSALTGEKEFIYTVIPERSGDLNIGRFIFDYFNIETSRYETLATDTITLNVTGDSPGRSEMLLDSDDESDRRMEFNLNLIILIILAVSGIVIALIVWERKELKMTIDRKPDKKSEGAKRKIEDISHRGVLLAIRRGDAESFLRESGNIINIIEKRIEDGEREIKTKVGEQIKGIKDSIYGYKYGGEKISELKMEALYSKIKELVDMME